MDAESLLERGRTAYGRQQWGEAYRCLSEADRTLDLAGEDLWRLAFASELVGRPNDLVDALDRAHRRFLDAGDLPAAARCAFWCGFRLLALGEVGPGSGWLRRARRFVDRHGRACVEQGYLMLADVQRLLGASDLDTAFATAAEAAEVGERFGDADLHAFALHAQGIARLRQTRLAEGLALVDEAMVAVVTQATMPVMTGIIYCSVISACHNVYALRRAQEWTEALAAWCGRQPDLVPFAGKCMVYRAEIAQLRGAWPEALEEARLAVERCERGSEADGVAEAVYQQGEIHRLRGTFAEAERAYHEAARLGRDPQPGLGLLRLAQGRRGTAVAGLRRALREHRDRTRRVRILPALIEALLAADELDAARVALDELESTAKAYEGSALTTVAAYGRGAVALASGDAPAALEALRHAWRGWHALEAPYEAARTRELVARACADLQDAETAALELEAAREAYRQLGAVVDLERLEGTPGSRAGLTARELEVLRLVAVGHSNKAIAGRLGVSGRTVERHLSNIFDKLDVSSRSAATAYAFENGLA